MAGLEVDFKAFLVRWKTVVIVGLGQIVINTILGIIVGVLVIQDQLDGAIGLIYFGLCCTFSSTILVLGVLKERKQLESLHGQIMLGLLVFQDITAVFSLAVLGALTDPDNPTQWYKDTC